MKFQVCFVFSVLGIHAYEIEHTGSNFMLDMTSDVASNPFIAQDKTNYLTSSGTAGITSTVDPATLPSYGTGLVALYPFDETFLDATQTQSSYRSSSPCNLPSSQSTCQDAILTGSVGDSIPMLSTNAKHGMSLSVAGSQNFAQIRPGFFRKQQPATGISQALWFRASESMITGAAPTKWQSGTLTELQFGNFDLQIQDYNACVICRIRGTAGLVTAKYCLVPNQSNVDYDRWYHMACTYDTSKNLNLYLDGALVDTIEANLPDDNFQHGNYQPFGIGNRPGTQMDYLQYVQPGQSSEEWGVLIDDVGFWDRALSASEIAALYASNLPLSPSPRMGLETKNIVRVGNNDADNPFGNEFEAIVVTWSVPAGQNPSNLLVEISTDSGNSWCPVNNGAAFSDGLHGGEGFACLFPSVTVKVRITWAGSVPTTLTSFSVDFHQESPLTQIWQNVPIGMNLAAVTYYSTSWTFTDIFKMGGGTSWPVVRSGVDQNGWPLEIDSAKDAPMGVYWIVGRNILMCCTDGNYPAGTYTLIAEGKGKIKLNWDSGSHEVETPCRYEFNVQPTDSGIQLYIEESELGNHVRNIQVYMPGFVPPGTSFISDTPSMQPVSIPAPVNNNNDCHTCSEGIVGHWEFDDIDNGALQSSTNSDVIKRAVSPALVGAEANIVGNGQDDPLVSGKFGRALSIPQGKANWASMFPSPLKQNAPATGFSGSIWLKPAGTNIDGLVWERLFGNFHLYGQRYQNRVVCTINGSDNKLPSIRYSLSTVDPSKWYHVVCTYDGTSKTLALYIDGAEVATGSAVLPDDKFRHGDTQALGLGNRAGSVSNYDQFAGNNHFVGAVDDFVLWDRTLSSEEVSQLYSSNKPVSQNQPWAQRIRTRDRELQSTASTPSIFHPKFLESVKSFSLLRFMDWGRTNSQQVAQWTERTTLSSVSQAHTHLRQIEITTIGQTSATPFSGQFTMLVVTSEPHRLTTGQLISIVGSDGQAALDNGNFVSFNIVDKAVEVVNGNSFITNFEGWGWDSSTQLSDFSDASQGLVQIRLSPGVSLEYQIQMVNELEKDGWFCVPHLATDDYVREMATLIRDSLNPNLKAYIEYSNEVWNWAPGFYQTRYAHKMATAEGDTSGDRHLKWSGRRSHQIFTIFDEVFGQTTARQRVVRVVGCQAGSGRSQMSQIPSGGADALAIAPYFGGGLNHELFHSTNWESISTDDILDRARRDVIEDTLALTKASAEIASQYGVKMIAYEGGQHMGGGGDCGSGGNCANIVALQAKFQTANRHPRMKGLYKNMFKAWSIGAGNSGDAFAAFSHIGGDSKWGSWGALQTQPEIDDTSASWKYQALVENIGTNQDRKYQ